MSVMILFACLSSGGSLFAEDNSSVNSAVLERVQHDIEFLASDALEGRGIETPGLEKAAEHIIAEYQRMGLKPAMPDGGFRQTFPVAIGPVRVDPSTAVVLHGPDNQTVSLLRGKQFQPIRRGRNGSSTGRLVFIGYGISSDEDGYDDYDGMDVEGCILVMIRREPRQSNDDAFNGRSNSRHSYIDTKMQLAVSRKAAGIIFVNDPHSSPSADRDDLTPPAGFGNEGDDLPFVHVQQAVINQLLQKSPLKVGESELTSLAEIEKHIDATMKPVSQPMPGWTADVTTRFESRSISTSNLIGVVEGEGPLANETIIIGAHYDHIGYGGPQSRTRNRNGEIHNGADDNATGTSAVLELARRFASGPSPRRRMMFICFSGEELGLLGSNYYVTHPVEPLGQTALMLNFDMIGNLRNNTVEVNGVGTAPEFADLVREADELTDVGISVVQNPFAGSDHLPFYQRDVPVLFCCTGLTGTYHTPDDDFERLNIPGSVKVIDYSEQLLRLADALPERPVFFKMSGDRNRFRGIPYLGIVPELGEYDDGGVLVRGLPETSPARNAGIQVGDILMKMGDRRLDDYPALLDQLTNQKPGDKVIVIVKRGEEEVEVSVELGKPRR
ncbi:MAG: M20/M25/M40 family metallo-hydrolase [Planctomycetaceae bacterium]